MALAVRSQTISRDKLATFLSSHDLIKVFENISQDVSTTIPDAINDQTDAIELAQATADTALVHADAAQVTATAAQTDIDAFELRAVPLLLTDAPLILVDASAHDSFYVTLGGNRTLDAPTGLVDGQELNFAVHQDATGSRTLAYNAVFYWGAAGAPTLTTTAGAVDYIAGYYDAGSGKILAYFPQKSGGGGSTSASSFSAHNNGVAQAIPNNALTKLTFSTSAYDVGSHFATSRWTPPAGPVSIDAAVSLPTAINLLTIVTIYKNGAEYKRGAQLIAPSANVNVATVSCQDIASGTDYYEAWVYQNTGASQNTAGASTVTYFQGTTIPAAAGIASVTTSKIQVYLNTATNSTTVGWQKCPVDTVSYDTSLIWDATNKRITPTQPGYYQLNLRARFNVNAYVLVGYGKNGTQQQAVGSDAGGATNTAAVGGSILVFCNGTTDYIEMFVYSTAVKAYTTGAFDTYMQLYGPV